MARFLALDWDQNHLHVISAEVRGHSVKVRRAAVWQEGRTPNPAEAEELGQLLRDRLKEAGIAPAPVLACIGRDRVIVKEVRYPQVPETEEPAIVRFQAIKELTDSPEDVVIDYATSGNASNGERKAAALIIRKEVLTTYQKLCQAAGLKLASLTPRLVGVSACVRQVMGKTVVTPPPEPVDGVIAVVVVGEKTAELCVLRDNTFMLARSMPGASNLASDIKRNLAVHTGQNPQAPVVAVYLAGKGAGELRERLSEVIDIPVHTFDPFAGSEAAELPTGNRGSFAGAMGLLHCRTAEAMPINFVAPRQPKPAANPNTRYFRAALIAWVLIVVGSLGIGRFVYARKINEAEMLEAAGRDVASKLTATTENGKRLKALDDWDTPVWIDEFYELTKRIPDVNALRATSINVEHLARTANSRLAGRVTIKGKLLDKKTSNPRKPLDELVNLFTKEGYYTPQVPKVEGDAFSLIVNIERRGPGEFKSRLEGEKTPTTTVPETPKDKGKDKGKTKSK